MRTAFLGGPLGQLLSGVLWLASGALAVWVGVKAAIVLLRLHAMEGGME